MRQFAGFGTAEETNERFRYLLDHGQTGLSTAFDMPSLMGHDSDHPRSEGEVGREGVAVDTLDDMELLFRGIPLGEVSTSMTINAPAAVMLAFYVVAAERQGVPPERLAGTIQTDILKEYIAQKEWCFPIDPAMRLVTDMVEFCAVRMPRWHPVSISGYHIREAGSTAVQELAFTLKDGFTYVEHALERGLDVDEFAPRLSFFFNAHIDFFEEIAKYRAARQDLGPRAQRHLRGARRAQPVDALPHADGGRVADRAAAARTTSSAPRPRRSRRCSAAPSRCTRTASTRRSALPTEEAVRVALRTQQIIAHETGVASTIDPLGGSYFVEALTDRMERRRLRLLPPHRRARRHGRRDQAELPAARDRRRQLPAPARDRARRARDRRRQPLPAATTPHTDTLKIPAELERKQIGRLQAVRAARDTAQVEQTLAALRDAAATDRNLMEPLLEAARAHATEGEIVQSLQRVFGTYTETPVF